MSTLELLPNLAPNIQDDHLYHVVERLAKNKGVKERDETKYLDMYWEPFLIAAVIGFTRELGRKKLSGKKSAPFKYSTIQTNSANSIKTLVAFCVATEGYEILNDHTELNKCIEEHANSGFDFLSEIIGMDKNHFNDETGYLRLIMELSD